MEKIRTDIKAVQAADIITAFNTMSLREEIHVRQRSRMLMEHAKLEDIISANTPRFDSVPDNRNRRDIYGFVEYQMLKNAVSKAYRIAFDVVTRSVLMGGLFEERSNERMGKRIDTDFPDAKSAAVKARREEIYDSFRSEMYEGLQDLCEFINKRFKALDQMDLTRISAIQIRNDAEILDKRGMVFHAVANNAVRILNDSYITAIRHSSLISDAENSTIH